MDEINQIGTVAALNIVGFLIKLTPAIPNRWIPHILVACGAIAEASRFEWTFDFLLAGAIKGVSAVGAHQLYSATVRPTDPSPPTPAAAKVGATL